MVDKSLATFAGYDDLLLEIKRRIRTAQVRAALAVNRELILLYWQIGRDILTKQQQQGWGAKVIDRLATDLKEVSINKGVNIVEDFRRLSRSVGEGISGIFRVGATKAGGEKTDEIDTFIYGHLLRTHSPR
jgi:hypothetical protein